MDDSPLPQTRRSTRNHRPKTTLNPPCAVFPDSLHTTLPPLCAQAASLNISSIPSTPAGASDSQYDYFDWSAVEDSHHSPDLSCAAPVGALGDDHSGGPGASLGAWYAFANGFQSSVGTLVFADQAADRRHRSGRRRRARYSFADSTICRRSCDRYHCQCSSPGHDSWATPYLSSDEEQDDDNDDDYYSDADDDHSSLAPSDSDETSDHYHWNRRTPTCLVNTSSPNLSTTPDSTQCDITAEQAANGMDVQGIPWETLPFSREDYRATRLRDGRRGDCLPECSDGLRDLMKEPRRGAQFFDFFKNIRRIKCTIVHFQLRNLAWATSKHDVYVMHDGTVIHWDAAAERRTQVIDLSGSGTVTANGLGIVQISTMIAKDDLVIAGGFYGEMVAKNVKTGSVIHNKRITYDENAITNAIDIFDDSIMTSNNDCVVRCFDISTFQKKSSFRFAKPVNHATRQPDGKMVAVAGDENPVQVIDGDSGDRIAQLHGHDDFSFATGWHPSGRLFATGSQDKTCRVWDVRNMSQCVSVLGAHTGAVRSLRFSACGRFLAMAEPRDYAHIYDVNRGEFDTCQEIDLFGEIAGIALTPCAEGLYIAVSDRTYSSLIEYERKTSSPLSDLIF